MKKIIACLLWTIIYFSFIQAQENKPVYFSGQISSDLDSNSIKLRVAFWPDYIKGDKFEYIWFDIPVDGQGRFHFTLPKIDHAGRIAIIDALSTNVLFTPEMQIVEPGDSIFLNGVIHDKEEPYYFSAQFSGRGSAKYDCVQALKLIDDNRIKDITIDLPFKLHIRDSLLNEKLKVLHKFKKQLTTQTYLIIKWDIYGDINKNILLSVSPIFYQKLTKSEIEVKRKSFEVFKTSVKTIVSDETLALSVEYPKFLYEKEKLNLAFIHKGYNFNFKDLYETLRDGYKGKLKEKLLTYCLLNDEDIYGIFSENAAENYTNCLKDAVSLVQTPLLKNKLEIRLSTRGTGAVAFNFTLPIDSSDRKLSLSDLKGKVILLDMWAYACTGCTLFAQAFHKKVYSDFKDNPEFAVVSIMLGESSKAAYMRRLRQEGGAIYTYSDYINLFGGKEEIMGREIERHYRISVFPFILLIDKKGKIHSSNIPFFTQPNSPNAEKLSALIKKEIAKP